MYTGEYKDLLRDGQSSYTFPGNFFHYAGEWQRGKMQGQGEFTMGDGTAYTGEFQDGEIQGVGLKRWPDGSSYSGHFEQGEMHGEGVYLSAKGERYEGHWENNQRCGHGELQFQNGDLYSGEFAAHLRNGRGKMVYASTGRVFHGEWVKGMKCGAGILQDASGNRLYEGSWIRDVRHGEGIGVLPIVNEGTDGSRSLWYDGSWKDDTPGGNKESRVHTHTRTTLPNVPLLACQTWIAHTTKIVAMSMAKVLSSRPATAKELGSRPATATGGQRGMSEVELYELPSQLIVDNKKLPTLAIVCTKERSEPTGDTVRVHGEHGRQFRLRIFEGTVPPQTSGKAEVDVVASSPGQFVSTSSQNKLQPSSDSGQVPSSNGQVSEAESTVEGSELPAEERLDAVTAEASAGLAVFRDLLLPATTLVGDYYLVCESLASDALPSTFIQLSVK